MKRRNTIVHAQADIPQQGRLDELSKIACERRNVRVKDSIASGGLWSPEQYLPDDLKEEYRMLTAAKQRQDAACSTAGKVAGGSETTRSRTSQ